jgi:hypothetical protein
LAILFFATLIRSIFGFGEALIAVPLLALCIPVRAAAPLAVLISTTVAAVVLVQDWPKVHRSSAGGLFLSSIFGIPLGLLLLTAGGDREVKGSLAVIIMAFAAFFLTGRMPPEIKPGNRSWLLGCGFCAGILGGAYGMNGPPLIIYGAMRRWSAQHFRATLQGYFLPTGIIGLAGFWLAGLWVHQVTRYYLLALPAVLAAIWLGRLVNRRMGDDAFRKYVYVALIGIGALLLVQAIRGKVT